jgi:hypothetical protein
VLHQGSLLERRGDVLAISSEPRGLRQLSPILSAHLAA